MSLWLASILQNLPLILAVALGITFVLMCFHLDAKQRQNRALDRSRRRAWDQLGIEREQHWGE